VIERRLGVPYPIWGAAGAREIVRLVEWADILHVHDCLYFGSALTVLLARRARKPVLLSQHLGFVRYPLFILNGIERLAYHTLGRAVLRRASHIVFCTQTAEAFVTTLLGSRPKAASAIPYGIDTERFRPPTHEERLEARRVLGLPESEPVALFVGRLVEKKGARLLLETSRQMRAHRFLMVGDGPLRPEGKDNLTWFPYVPNEKMELVYRAADVFLLPSHSEGFPVAVLEAMASGLPVIAPLGQPFTTVLEGEQACLPAERTPAALCRALRNLAGRPALADTLGSRSRSLVEQEWSLASMKSRYLTLIRDLVAGR
jgi:glycosyltransferase involved in cell wall biosynthesis